MTVCIVHNLALLLLITVGCDRSAGTWSPPGAGPPMAADAAFELGRWTFSGTVQEALAAGGYTYFRLRTDAVEAQAQAQVQAQDRWVVAADRSHRGAARLTVRCFGLRRGFVSRRLNRTFAVLYFGSLSDAEPKGGL